MFSSKPKPLSSPSRVSIEEANSHLKLVHQRVEQLETMVNKRDQQMKQSEDSHRQEVQRMTTAYDKHCDGLNKEIELLKNRVKELETKVMSQKEIIEDNEQKMHKLSQVLQLRPNLDKLLRLLNGLAVDDQSGKEVPNHSNVSAARDETLEANQTAMSSEQMNGFCDTSPVVEHNGPVIRSTVPIVSSLVRNSSSIGTEPELANTCNKWTKKSVKYREDFDTLCVNGGNGGKDDEVVSITSTSTSTSGQSPSVKDLSLSGTTPADRHASHRKSSNSKLRIGRSFKITANFSDEEEVATDKRVTTRRNKVTAI